MKDYYYFCILKDIITMNNIKIILQLICTPEKAWNNINERNIDYNLFLNRFLYPVMGITSASVFIRLVTDSYTLQQVLQGFTIIFVKYFIGFFIAAYLINECASRFYGIENNIKRAQKYTGYLLSIPMVVTIVMNILPGISFLELAPLYVIYVPWKGGTFIGIKAEKGFSYIIFSIIVLLSPMVVQMVLYMILPGLNK